MQEGLIIKGIGGFYYVKIGQEVIECRARGIFRKDGMTPLPGDRVLISVDDNKSGSVEEILTRKNDLVRPAVANIDQVVIVVSAKIPPVDYFLIDKLLISANLKNISASICVNKIDIDTKKLGEEILNIYAKAGYKVFIASAKTGMGIDNLKAHLENKITVFAGQSGVGKSTLLNFIMHKEVMKTADCSEKIERGKHTTRHAEIVELDNGGFLVDTPGFSSFDLDQVSSYELESFYQEFEREVSGCRFKGCGHLTEPDCAIIKAVREGRIDKSRYDRYCVLYVQIKSLEKNKYK